MNTFWKIVCVFLLCLSFSHATEKVVIIGSGPAGLTAAIFAGQAFLEPLVIEEADSQGQAISIAHIENYPGYPEGISGAELLEKMRKQAEIFGTRFYASSVVAANLSQRPFLLTLANGTVVDCESLIIATGSGPKWLGLESEKALFGKGVTANALKDGPQFADQELVVYGGGDAAMEQALHLAEYASKVTVIYKRNAFFASAYLQERVLNHPKMTALLDTDIVAISDPSMGFVSAVTVKNAHTQLETTIPCAGVLIANGRQPNTAVFKDMLEMTKEGFFKTKNGTSEASVPGVFIAGDIAELSYRKIVTATASGCISAIDANRYLQNAPPVLSP